MPYVTCPSCRLQSFTAAAFSSRDECPRCGHELSREHRTLSVVSAEGAAGQSPSQQRGAA